MADPAADAGDEPVTCLDCGRVLRDPASQTRRRGPVCQSYHSPPVPTRPTPARPARRRRAPPDGQPSLLDGLPRGEPAAAVP